MLNDIRTLQMEPFQSHALQGPGDVREGYETRDYQTKAQSLERRKGVSARLWTPDFTPPPGLPPIPVPAQNPLTAEKSNWAASVFRSPPVAQQHVLLRDVPRTRAGLYQQ